jgi:tetraacyldisaccharide 4'-kinase
MKTPAFWTLPAGPLAWAFAPLGWLYGRITAWRMARPGARAGVRVVCIGNFTAGGAGKTPTALLAAEMAVAAGMKPFILTRGHGGRITLPTRVDAARHGAADCGDEPLLLARIAPVIVARDRAAGAAEAVARGAGLIIMDDGLQNPSLAKDFVIAVVDGATGAGNGLCLPAGPLRAPLAAQLRHVTAVLVIGPGAAGDAVAALAAAAGKPVLRGALEPDARAVAALRGKPLLAFAGIGRPEKFFATLRESGLDVRVVRAFADHRAYGPDDLSRLAAEAGGLTLVTTEKDAVRLPPGAPACAVLPVRLRLDAPSADRLAAWLSSRTPPAT